MKHLALATKFGTLACSPAVSLDAAKRLWNVALPLADTAAGRAILFSSLRVVLMQMAKGGVIDGGPVRAQVKCLALSQVACIPVCMREDDLLWFVDSVNNGWTANTVGYLRVDA